MSGIPTQLRINKMNLKYHPQECCASALFSWLLFEIDAFIHHAAAAIESPDLIHLFKADIFNRELRVLTKQANEGF